jgi:hypothetical protein
MALEGANHLLAAADLRSWATAAADLPLLRLPMPLMPTQVESGDPGQGLCYEPCHERHISDASAAGIELRQQPLNGGGPVQKLCWTRAVEGQAAPFRLPVEGAPPTHRPWGSR